MIEIKKSIHSMFNELFNTKIELLKSNIKLIEINDLIEYYRKNKEELFLKKENFEKNLLEYFSKIDFKFSFSENEENNSKYIKEIIDTLEDLYQETFDSITKDIRIKTIEKIKKLINFIGLLYINNVNIIFDYSLIFVNVKIERAPPVF